MDKDFLMELFADLRSGRLTSGNPEVRESWLARVAGMLGVDTRDNVEQAYAKVYPPRPKVSRVRARKEEEDGVGEDG